MRKADFDSSLYKLIGEKIKTSRTGADISQEILARKVDIGRTSISNIELGRHHAPLHLIYRICKALDVDVHSVIPTFAEVDETMKKADDGIMSQLAKTNLPNKSKKNLEFVIEKMTTS